MTGNTPRRWNSTRRRGTARTRLRDHRAERHSGGGVGARRLPAIGDAATIGKIAVGACLLLGITLIATGARKSTTRR